jgi:protoporphyrinogen oxidase
VETATYKKNVLILGGGISGLSAAYHLKRNNASLTVFDALDKPGGNCRTIQRDGFMFDTGAHRIHDKDKEVTKQVKELLGEHLKRIDAPSKIFDNGRYLSFPLEFQDVFRRMDKCFTVRAGIDLLKSRNQKGSSDDFESFAVHSYGRSMAERFLLNYSRKLWGVPCKMLSPDVSGERLKSMTLITLLQNFISRRYAESAHYEGEFYYPDRGIGQLSEAIAQFIGFENIRLNSRVTGIFHGGKRIEGIMIDGHDSISINQVISTLSIADFITMMRPAPPPDILNKAKSLKFRNIRLAVFFIHGESINNAATMYFPADQFIFTRGYEPKNRSRSMSPQGMTSFVVEVPCFEHEWEWNADHADFIKKVREQIIETRLIRDKDIIGCTDERIVNAYPVLEKDYKEKVMSIFEYLSRFENLEVSGRIGLFKYLWIHNLLREGQDIAGRVVEKMST